MVRIFSISKRAVHRNKFCFANRGMPDEDFAPKTHSMPQIDFARAFENVGDAKPEAEHGPFDEFPLVNGPRAAAEIPAEAEPFRDSPIGRSAWLNVIFVSVMVVGGLVCASYFFNGAELIRAVASWPAELLYSRPNLPEPAKIDNQTPEPVRAGIPVEANARATEHGPFRQNAKNLLEANTSPQFGPAPLAPNPNGFASAPPLGSGANALLGQLGGTALGGDSLLRTLNEGAVSLQQTTVATVNNVTATVTRTGAQTTPRVLTTARKTIRPAHYETRPRTVTTHHPSIRPHMKAAPLSTNAQLGLDKRGIGPGIPGGIGPGVLGGVGGHAGGGGGGGIGHGGGIGAGGGGIGGIGGGLPGGLMGGRR